MALNAKVLKLINDYLRREPPLSVVLPGRQVEVKVIKAVPSDSLLYEYDVVITLTPDIFTTAAIEYAIGIDIHAHIHNILRNMFGIDLDFKIKIKVHHPRIQ